MIFDSTVSFDEHIKSITKTAFFHLKVISRLCLFLSNSCWESLSRHLLLKDLITAMLYPMVYQTTVLIDYTTQSRTQLPEYSITLELGSIIHPLFTIYTGPQFDTTSSLKFFSLSIILLWDLHSPISSAYYTLTPWHAHSVPLMPISFLFPPLNSAPYVTSFSVTGPPIWNALHLGQCKCSSIADFNAQLKSYLFRLASLDLYKYHFFIFLLYNLDFCLYFSPLFSSSSLSFT